MHRLPLYSPVSGMSRVFSLCVCEVPKTCEGKLKHLGISASSDSTLPYASRDDTWDLYQHVLPRLFDRCQTRVIGKKGLPLKNELVSMDSFIIDLCLKIFGWAHFRRTKGPPQLHLPLDHEGYLLSFEAIPEGSLSDVRVACRFEFDPATIVMDHRGYDDCELFGR